jgi:hypothetical protein
MECPNQRFSGVAAPVLGVGGVLAVRGAPIVSNDVQHADGGRVFLADGGRRES